MNKKNDVVSNPDHYKMEGLGIEVKDIIKSALGTVGFLGFYKGNIIKYILRANKKNGLEDYKKARQYLDWYIQELESDRVDDIDGQMSYLEEEVVKDSALVKEIIIPDLSGKMHENEVEIIKDSAPRDPEEIAEMIRKSSFQADRIMKDSAPVKIKEDEERVNLVGDVDENLIKVTDTNDNVMKDYRKLHEKLSKKVTK